jgi:hypothetical protein
MDYHHHESKYKPQPRRRSGKDNPGRGAPTRGSVTKGRVEPTPQTQYSIYSGRDRLGSFRIDGDAYTAFDRLGCEIGTFSSQNEAIVAIERGAKS